MKRKMSRVTFYTASPLVRRLLRRQLLIKNFVKKNKLFLEYMGLGGETDESVVNGMFLGAIAIGSDLISNYWSAPGQGSMHGADMGTTLDSGVARLFGAPYAQTGPLDNGFPQFNQLVRSGYGDPGAPSRTETERTVPTKRRRKNPVNGCLD